jgi:hypothetical protein
VREKERENIIVRKTRRKVMMSEPTSYTRVFCRWAPRIYWWFVAFPHFSTLSASRNNWGVRLRLSPTTVSYYSSRINILYVHTSIVVCVCIYFVFRQHCHHRRRPKTECYIIYLLFTHSAVGVRPLVGTLFSLSFFSPRFLLVSQPGTATKY